MLAWATFAGDSVLYVTGTPHEYPSSEHGQREFCGHCGTQIAFRNTETATTVDINVGSFDAPGSFKPQYHIWTQSRIPWFETDDELPRYVDEGPDSLPA